MNKVQRAVILAAGKGERMLPLTKTTPKPLIKVHGQTMIESIIQALHSNGIFEIYIVVGYLKEQFYYLEDKYEGIQLIANPYYDNYNNISSLYMARNHIENAFVLDGDQLIHSNNILQPTFLKSGYNVVWSRTYTNEWLLQINESGKVISCNRTGGKKGWQLFSISRWSREDAATLKLKLEEEFEINKNHKAYWDDVPLFLHAQYFDLTVYEMKKGDVVEIDNVEELSKEDESYQYVLDN